MLAELAVSTFMVLLTVAIHGVGLYALGRILRLERDAVDWASVHPMSPRGFALTFALVFGLFALHGTEIWLYAFAFHALDAVPDLRTGVYFSTITYATIGYSDAPIAEGWKLVAAIEGINGVLLIGWSTAFFVTIMTRMGPHRRS